MVVEHEETLEQIASEEEDEQAAVPIYKIVSYPADPTLEVLHQRWQRKEIIIPKFQREPVSEVWVGVVYGSGVRLKRDQGGRY